jgi:hypothetical protein
LHCVFLRGSAIDGPGHVNVELAPARVPQQGIEARPTVSALGAGDAGVLPYISVVDSPSSDSYVSGNKTRNSMRKLTGALLALIVSSPAMATTDYTSARKAESEFVCACG